MSGTATSSRPLHKKGSSFSLVSHIPLQPQPGSSFPFLSIRSQHLLSSKPALLSPLSLLNPERYFQPPSQSPSFTLQSENHWHCASNPHHWQMFPVCHTRQETRLPDDSGFKQTLHLLSMQWDDSDIPPEIYNSGTTSLVHPFQHYP